MSLLETRFARVIEVQYDTGMLTDFCSLGSGNFQSGGVADQRTLANMRSLGHGHE